MKVLLLKDIYKLGHAGDVKKVAIGYGRNYLIPQGLALLATPGSLKMAEYIRGKGIQERNLLNDEMRTVADNISGTVLVFSTRAGDTGKLYGSITTQNIADKLSEKLGIEIDRRQIEAQPIRNIGEHKAEVRLTVDLVPIIKIIVHREGEALEEEIAVPPEAAEELAIPAEAADDNTDPSEVGLDTSALAESEEDTAAGTITLQEGSPSDK